MSRGGSRGFGGRGGGGRGGGRGGFQQRDMGPPDQVLEMGTFVHAVEDEMFCSSLIPDKVPYFNAPIYLQNKSVIGKVDEILGPINEVYFSIKMGEGMVASSFKKGDKVYIGGDKLLPIERFLPKPKVAGGVTSEYCYLCITILQALIISNSKQNEAAAAQGGVGEVAEDRAEGFNEEEAEVAQEVVSLVAVVVAEEVSVEVAVVVAVVDAEDLVDAEEDSEAVEVFEDHKLAECYVLSFVCISRCKMAQPGPCKNKTWIYRKVH
ncbi:hypothetical protein D9613_002879 [Agrocybe pediades]|uniref:H/ACA ribonucleoprotein complex subunit n=1 Tax=Agrocybe pediades TaxID=84607 RepID=A0A8H4VL20_9AGAR|nr:hypothetical protein D9613_002879 [Agrocybe pediades]